MMILNSDRKKNLPGDSSTRNMPRLLNNGKSQSDEDSSFFWTPEKSSDFPTLSSSTQGRTTPPASVTPSCWNSIGNRVSPESTVIAQLGKLSLDRGNGRVSTDYKNLTPSEGQVKCVTDDKNLNPTEEQLRMSQVGRKKNFVCVDNINGKPVNVLQGLELHTRVFNHQEQKKIVDYVYSLQQIGRSRKLRERTYTEPRKWMRGKGRVTIQFGCCYNYAVDKHGNPPGIIRDEEVDPIPSLFKSMIKRMVRWHILPPTCIPNSCIVNIYDEGDCIPPHIDHHDFVRPFCTVSFLTESNILFGSNLKIIAPGEFSGSASIPLPVGSVLILNGNGADLAKHCVPAVLGKRISITFRKMDDSKLPFEFSHDPELQGIQPLTSSPMNKLPIQQIPPLQNLHHQNRPSNNESEISRKSNKTPLQFGETDFPPLGASISSNKSRSKKN